MSHVILGRRKKAERTPAFDPLPIIPVEQVEVELPIVTERVKVKVEKTNVVKKVTDSLPVTVLIINYKTEHLVKKAYSTLRQFYPNVSVIIVDNGSRDSSTRYLLSLKNRDNTEIRINDRNIGHGPAMHAAIKTIDTPYVLTFDSDCEMKRGELIELMLEHFKPNVYAVGWRRWVDRLTGVPLEWHLDGQRPSDKFVPYAHPACSIYDISKYLTLLPFYHHGAPVLQNMVDANRRGFEIVPFQVFSFINHLKAGTRRMYEGRWNPKDGEKPGKWDERKDYPI